MSASAWKPFVLGVSPCGPARSRTDHPGMPLTPEELAASAADAVAAGAALVRLHVRDESMRPTLAPRAVAHAIELVAKRVGRQAVIQPAAIAGTHATPLDIVNVARETRPETVALALDEVVPDERSLSESARFLAWLARERIAPHYLLSGVEHVERYLSLRGRGVLPDAPHLVEFVPPPDASGIVRASALLPMIAAYRGDMPWTCQGAGTFAPALAATAMATEGHAIVGFDFNVLLADGTAAPDNAAIVRQTLATLAGIGRPRGDADCLRSLIGG